jgi:2-keto-3-deoxy-L-rhamnonate aldolase RhmA
MIKFNTVKALQKAGRPAFGTWITLCPHPRVVKILAAAGFDFVIVEMEHTDFSFETVGVLCMLARETGLTPIVRPPGALKPHDLTRPLDAGAQGLLLPAVETAEQLADIVKSTKYHPLGSRPMNLRGPHTDYFNASPREIIDHLNAETMTVAMVESCRAIDNLREILEVPGLDCVMIGPDDLSQDLGVPGEMQAPVLLDAFEEIFRRCQDARVPYGLSAQTPEMAQRWIEKGATWVPYQNDAAMVLNAARAAVPQLMQIGGRA